TCAALHALLRVDHVSLPDLSDDGVRRTGPCAERTSLTFIRIDPVLYKVLTDTRRTFLIHDMGDVFVPEISQGGEHRIGRRLSQGTQGVLLQMITELLQF